MIVQMKWKSLLETLKDNNPLLDTSLKDLVYSVNNQLNERLGNGINISGQFYKLDRMFDYVINNFIKGDFWNDMDISVSSYSVNSLRLYYVYNDLVRKFSFVSRVLNDNELSTIIINNRLMNEKGDNKNNQSNVYSDLPQVDVNTQSQLELDLSYVSNTTNNKVENNYNRNVNDENKTSSKTFKEQMELLNYTYMNDLAKEIVLLPQKIFNTYSLDVLPSKELIKNYFGYIDTMIKL